MAQVTGQKTLRKEIVNLFLNYGKRTGANYGIFIDFEDCDHA